jgi:hypothetical protein
VVLPGARLPATRITARQVRHRASPASGQRHLRTGREVSRREGLHLISGRLGQPMSLALVGPARHLLPGGARTTAD